jgi:hypothetical protein
MMTIVLGLWSLVLLAPETPIGRFLRRALVVAPAARLSRITRGEVLLVLLLVGGIGIVGALLGQEGVRLLSMGAPELASFLTAFEITAYLDALAAVVALYSTTNLRTLKARVVALLPRKANPRSARARRTARPARDGAANDDEHPGGIARAA